MENGPFEDVFPIEDPAMFVYRSVSATLLVYSPPSATKSPICSEFVGEKGCISLEFGKIVSFSDGTGKTPALL